MISSLYNNIIRNQGRIVFLGFLLISFSLKGQDSAVFNLFDYYGTTISKVHYDGGILIAGQEKNNQGQRPLLKIDKNGVVVWKLDILEEDSMLINDLGILSNGDMVLSGSTLEYSNPFENENSKYLDGVLIKINTCGEIEWLNIETRHPHGELKVADGFKKIHIDDNDHIWVHQYLRYKNEEIELYANGKEGSKLTINKYNIDGELLARTEDFFFRKNSNFRKLLSTSDGGLLAVGFGPFYSPFVDTTTATSIPERALVVKYDSECEIEWYNAYRVEEDSTYEAGNWNSILSSTHLAQASDAIKTDSNTYIVSGGRLLWDTIIDRRYVNHIFYEITEDGEIIRDHYFDSPKSSVWGELEHLNDTTLVMALLVKERTSYEDASQLEIWKIDAQTWEIEEIWVDTSYTYRGLKMDVTQDGKLAVGVYRTISPNYVGWGTQLQMFNTYPTIHLDTIPDTDTTNYDYLCGGTFEIDIIDLPDDTMYYEPIGVEEFKEIGLQVWVTELKDLIIDLEIVEVGYTYQILDMQGKILHTGILEESKNIISVADLPNGTYVLNVQTPEGVMKGEKFSVY